MDKDETERINAQNDVKEQAWSIRKQTDAVLKLTKVVLNNLSEKERELLEKMSAKDIKTYVKFKAHKNRLKLAKLKKQNIIQSFKRGEIIFETKRGLEGRTLLTLRRGAGELIVFTKAKNLIDYVIDATSRSPKKFRFTLVAKIQNYALSIIENLYRANEVLVIKNDQTKKSQRQAYQRRALSELNLMEFMCELAYRHDCILKKQYVQIAKQGYEVETLIYNWIDKDSKRFN